MTWPKFWRHCFWDRRGRLVLYQRPNGLLMTWAVAWLAAWLLHATAHHVIRLVGGGALFAWAVLEVLDGVNYFRRALGLAVLVAMVAWR